MKMTVRVALFSRGILCLWVLCWVAAGLFGWVSGAAAMSVALAPWIALVVLYLVCMCILWIYSACTGRKVDLSDDD